MFDNWVMYGFRSSGTCQSVIDGVQDDSAALADM